MSASPSSADENLILSLGSYEGPLDLLLGLARQKRVDLRQIPIAALAEQYLDFVSRATRLHLAVKAEYLVMATHLARMKARLLLPRDKEENAQGERSAEELRANLLWLERARETARLLRTLPRLGSQIFTCGAVQRTLPDSVVSWELEATLFELLQSYVAIERRRERKAKGLRIRPLRLYDPRAARSALCAQLDREWRDLLRLIPASAYRQAEKEEDARLFLKSIVSGFFSAALELASGDGGSAQTTQQTQNGSGRTKQVYAELYQPSQTSPLQVRLRNEGEGSALSASPDKSSYSASV